MKKSINILLIMAAISYVLAVIIGGFLKENYSHVYNAISELSEVGTKNIAVVNILFLFYNYILIIYSVLYLFLYKKTMDLKTMIIYILIFICGLSGIMMEIFPQEPRGIELTIKGIMHFVFAGIAAIATILITVLSWIKYKKINETYSSYSLMSFIVIFVAGLVNIILMNIGVDNFFGLIERITIGSFIVWLFVTGLYKYNDKHEI